ncbi:hypothetical protein COB18_00045 [Candidatus Kaiserbacteria bacterium]|nr:MAG: hypothetical protein COB18_00045 [Candidatus Kaiserbacteria bacterium]
MIKIILSFAAGFAVSLMIVWGWNAYADRNVKEIPATTTTPESMEVPKEVSTESITNEVVDETPQSIQITVTNQSAGESVTVQSATLDTDGWIVVHEQQGGFIGNALGAKRVDAGTYSNTNIPLLRATVANSAYWIVLYSDNGDRQFNLSDDFPLRDVNKNPVISSFQTF